MKRDSGIAITFLLVIGIVLSFLGRDKSGDGESRKSDTRYTTREVAKPTEYYVEIAADRPSASVKLDPTKHKRILWGAIDSNVPFRVIINGGRALGGIEYDTPSLEEILRTGWKPPFFENKILEVQFKHLRAGMAQVWCKIE